MAEFPYLPLATDAYLADTTHLSTEEHGAYLLLLMTAWRSGQCRLPDDDDYLARVCRCSLRAWRRMRPVLAPFWCVADGWWTQKRLTKERKFVDGVREKRRMAAHAKHRKNKETDAAHAGANAPEMHQHFTSLDSESHTNTESHEPEEVSHPKFSSPAQAGDAPQLPSKGATGTDFERFWKAYPRKVGKDAAVKAFARAAKKVSVETMLAAIERYRQTKPIGQDYCHPTVWLNQGRWQDEENTGEDEGAERRKVNGSGPKPLNHWVDAHEELIDMFKQRGDYHGEQQDESGTHPSLPRKAAGFH